MSKKILYILLFVSFSVNLFVFYIDTIPFLIPIVERKLSKENPNKIQNYELFENKIADRAYKMAKSNKNLTIWKEQSGFTETAVNLFNNDNILNEHNQFYHYPRAFLYYGLSEYYIKKNDFIGIEKFRKEFDKLINENGDPNFKLNYVDQVPFGLTALNLYNKGGSKDDEKYLAFAKKIFQKHILENMNKLDIIEYRKGQTVTYCDLLGMIVPFLVEYYKTTQDKQALDIAKHHMNYYILNGLDKDTYIPAHGIDLNSNIKVGSVNWGRGIGWYLLGLTAINNLTGEYEKELTGIYLSLNKLKTKENLFGQFPGSSDHFDASASTIIMYSFGYANKLIYYKSQILDLFSPYILKDGSLSSTSGDTYGLNSYSKTFGNSELSQGMFLLMLSIAK